MIAAVVHAKFAPYHDARLAHAARVGQKAGHELHGVEVAGRQRDYSWAPVTPGERDFELHRLFPDRDYWDVGPGEIHAALSQLLDRIRPDVLVLPGWGFAESRAGLRWSAKNGVPTVLVSDSQPIDTPRRPVRSLVRRFLVRQFTAAFAAGQPHRRYLEDLGMPAARISLGCDVVDNERFANATPPSTQGPPTLVSCLRLLPRKNVPFVLDVLAKEAPEWHWILVGDGPQAPEVRRRIADHGLEGRVRLLGHVPEERLPDEYAQGDVYLQPSLSEPWGLAVNEAMAAGRPVLVSQACGCREDLVRPGENGFLFDPRDPGSLAHALQTMLARRDEWEAMGAASRSIVSSWGLDRYADGLWKSCAMALSARPHRRSGIRDRMVALALRR